MAYEVPNEAGGYESGTPVNTTTAVPAPQPFVPTRPEGLSVPNPSALTPEQSRALPAPPANYQPGISSAARYEQSSGLAARIANAFSSVHGDIPLSMKIRLAQQDADLKLSQNKLAWDTYYQHNANYTKDIQQHNAHMVVQGLSLKPMMQDEIWMAKPEDKQAVTDHWVKTLNGFGPGLGDMALRMYKSPGITTIQDLMLNEPGPIGDANRDLAKQQGIEKWISTPQTLENARIKGHDLLWLAQANLPRPLKDKLIKGDLTEEEFSQAMPEVAFNLSNKGWTQQHARAAQGFMTEPDGQGALASMGIKLNASSIAIQKKEKPGANDPITQYKHDDFLAAKAKIDFAKANPGIIPDVEVLAAQDKVDTYANLKAKETNPGASPNVPFNIAIAARTQGKVKSIEDISKLPASEQPAMWKIAHEEQVKIQQASALAGNVAKNLMTHDSIAHPVYKLQNGKIKRIDQAMTEQEYRTTPGGFTMTAAQIEHNNKIDAAEIGGKQLLAQAAKAYKAKTAFERGKEVAAESVLSSGPGMITDQARAIAAANYPELAAYVARRDAVLGTYAKGLGGEAGVLTDQDIARVKKLFSGAYDNASTRAAKEKAFQQIIDLNRTALTNVLGVNQGTGDEGQVTPAQWLELQDKYKDKVQGILGNVEDKVNKAGSTTEPAQPGARSLADPKLEQEAQDAGDRRTRGETLLEKMRKGK